MIHVIDQNECHEARIIAFCAHDKIHRVVYGREHLFMVDELALLDNPQIWHFASDPMIPIRTFSPMSAEALVGRIAIIFRDLDDGTGFTAVILEHLPLVPMYCPTTATAQGNAEEMRFRVMDVHTTTFFAINLSEHPYYTIA